jgi:lon-related putative ATP-dependent protease
MEDPGHLQEELESHRCNPNIFSFETTAEVDDTINFIGQRRAHEAIQFGIRIKHNGYNLYALGQEGIGKHFIVNTILKQEALKRPTPPDWCYVYNFKKPRHPVAIQLPPGVGSALKQDMEKLVDDLKTTLPALFETIEHQARIKQIVEEMTVKQQEYFNALQQEAEEQEMTILSTSKGFVVVPSKGGKVLSARDLESLSKEERRHTEEVTEELNEHLANVIRKVQKLHKDRIKQEKDSERQFAGNAAKRLISKLKKKYKDLPRIIKYFDDVQEDIVSNVKLFLKPEEKTTSSMWGESHPSEFDFSRYQINVIIDNANQKGAPVLYEDNPRDYNIIGRIEHVSQLGTLMTDFTLIRPGALHRANGGFLIIDTHKILEHTWAWEALKRALITKEIKISLPPHTISVTSTSTLEADPIPLDIKIVLIGNRFDFYDLRDTDALFNILFKVAVDFEETIHRNETTIQLFAKLLATHAKKMNTRPLDRFAVARVIDQCSRLAEDIEKISIQFNSILELLEEADHWAEEADHDVITESDVQHAIDSQLFRLDHNQQLLYEEIQRGILLIKTDGKNIGQINALTTYRFGEFTFGFPSRITASVRMGREGIIDIEREVNLSGPIHSKGILILSGFLRGRFAPKMPLTLSASIVFEQSYGSIDGDSASVAELCSLLSALAKIPIKQTLAVTGSVNQHGLVQAIGNVNEKVEGFFEICKKRGLLGDQGVVIPKINVKNLLLKKDLLEAIKNNEFHIYTIETIDEAIEILLGVPAGERNDEGNYPEGTVNFLVEKQLEEFAKIHRRWARGLLY